MGKNKHPGFSSVSLETAQALFDSQNKRKLERSKRLESGDSFNEFTKPVYPRRLFDFTNPGIQIVFIPCLLLSLKYQKSST